VGVADRQFGHRRPARPHRRPSAHWQKSALLPHGMLAVASAGGWAGEPRDPAKTSCGQPDPGEPAAHSRRSLPARAIARLTRLKPALRDTSAHSASRSLRWPAYSALSTATPRGGLSGWCGEAKRDLAPHHSAFRAKIPWTDSRTGLSSSSQGSEPRISLDHQSLTKLLRALGRTPAGSSLGSCPAR
jgi:hypothetical protein